MMYTFFEAYFSKNRNRSKKRKKQKNLLRLCIGSAHAD